VPKVIYININLIKFRCLINYNKYLSMKIQF